MKPSALCLAAVATFAGAAWALQTGNSLQTSGQVPDVPALLVEVQKNQKAIDRLVEQYACRKRVEELEPAKNGGYHTKGVKEYEVFYLAGEEVHRLVAKDGKPLPPDEVQAENRQAEKKVRDLLRKQEKRLAREARGEKERDEPGISTFLRVDRFSNPRHVDFRGQNVAAFDFRGNPGFQPKTRFESAVQKLVGTVWVDDRAKEVVKLEAHFVAPMRIGGGLVGSIHEGSAFVFEQTLVNQEVWLPSYVEVHLSAHLLFKGLRQDLIIHYSDYKEFRVETLAKTERGKAKSR